jgi:hypothetical protein
VMDFVLCHVFHLEATYYVEICDVSIMFPCALKNDSISLKE